MRRDKPKGAYDVVWLIDAIGPAEAAARIAVSPLLSLPASGPQERRAQARERQARLAALDPEQLPMALTFLSGYHPRVFDAILNAVEPCTEVGVKDDGSDQEPFCVSRGAPVAIFLAHGKDYRHYHGALTPTSKPKPYKTDHAPIIAWRPVTTAIVPAAR